MSGAGARTLSYYPGCSLHGTAAEYDISTRAVCGELGLELKEVPDWNCCGATSAHSTSSRLATLLAARNIKIIEGQGMDVIIPCAACFSRIKICDQALKKDEAARAAAEDRLNFRYRGNTKIYHLVELLAEEIGVEQIKRHVKRYLSGLSAVCYYGCLLVRPHDITKLDDKENPQFLDTLMSAIGVNTIDWPYKTECCGAALSLSKSRLVEKLVGNMIQWAMDAGANAVVTACPLCQSNLEMRQVRGQHLPVYYFTELLGLAFGLKEVEMALKQHLVGAEEALAFLKEAGHGRKDKKA